MRCDEFREQLETWIDGELSVAQADLLRLHAQACADCRAVQSEAEALDQTLRLHVCGPASVPNEAEWLARLANAAQSTQEVSSRRPRGATTIGRRWAVALSIVIGSVLAVWLGRDFVLRLAPSDRMSAASRSDGVARVEQASGEIQMTRATGRVECIIPPSTEWQEMVTREVSLSQEGARVRTTADALCELRVGEHTTLRMAESTEIGLRSRKTLELQQGRLWVRTEGTSLEIVLPRQSTSNQPPVADAPTTAPEARWQCAANATLQCESSSTDASIQALQTVTLEEVMTHFRCPLAQLDKVVVSHGNDAGPPVIQRFDPQDPMADDAMAWYWQLPLLALDGNDPDLLALLTRMLPDELVLQAKAHVGATKLDFFYDQQIRELGPRAAPPLLAFVRSPASRETPARRERAMRLACELADTSAETHLIELTHDRDPQIVRLAQETLKRL